MSKLTGFSVTAGFAALSASLLKIGENLDKINDRAGKLGIPVQDLCRSLICPGNRVIPSWSRKIIHRWMQRPIDGCCILAYIPICQDGDGAARQRRPPGAEWRDR